MPATYSYATILHAVGKVLDEIGVRSFAIREEEDGLFVEGFNSDGQLQVQMSYDIASLYELVNGSENKADVLTNEGSSGLLRRFLSEHDRELVGASL